MAAADEARHPDMLGAALGYLAEGWPVFPICSPLMGQHIHAHGSCLSPGKVPMVPWAAFQTTLPEVGQIRSWWTQWPHANIGMATGELSGVLVLDADGTEARKECLKRGGLDGTRAVWTGKVGGAHYHLRYPPGSDIRNFNRRLPGIDLRGQGGYVLLPPSAHASGASYRWIDGTEHARLVSPPAWLLELIRGTGPSSDETWRAEAPSGVEELLAGFDEGQRDDGLFRFACRMRHDDTPQPYAEILIQVSARNCRPPFPLADAVAKVRAVYDRYPPGSAGPTINLDEDATGTGPAGAEAEGWRIYDVEEFLAVEYPPTIWRVESYLRDRAILFGYGAPGTIKTYVATDAALAIASGGLFLGRFPCQQGRVLIVQEDTQASDYQRAYLKPMIEARGLRGSDIKDMLFIAPPGEFALDRQERLNELCAWLREYKPDMLILDTFYMMYSGKSEDLLAVMKVLRTIRDAFGCAIWIIDHNRKSSSAPSSGEDAMDRLIGGREKSGSVDTIIEFRRVKGQEGAAYLDVLKLRGNKSPDSIMVSYDGGVLTVDGKDPETTPGAAKTVYGWLIQEGGGRTKAQISRGCDLSERSVHYAIRDLELEGLVRITGKDGRANQWGAVLRADAEPQEPPFVDVDE